MNVLGVRVEARITDDEVNANWQLTDPEATLSPNLSQVRQLDTAFTETLLDTQ